MAAQRAVPARVELFFKSAEELSAQVLLLSGLGVNAFNVTNKHKEDKMLEWIDRIGTAAPRCSVCAHFSLKANSAGKRAGPDATYQRFSDFMAALTPGRASPQVEVLLISGSGDKRPLDTVDCLRRLRADSAGKKFSRRPSVGVAFNPYFQDAADLDKERSRLVQKLETGAVESVWLQFGSDMELLTSALSWLSALGPQRPQRIVGSLFLPTAKLLAQQRYRPWNGVFLSEAYLSGPEAATAVTSELLAVYRKFGVEVLAEAPGIRSAKDLALLTQLLGKEAPPLGVVPQRRVASVSEVVLSSDKAQQDGGVQKRRWAVAKRRRAAIGEAC